jgi:hypothetical protein
MIAAGTDSWTTRPSTDTVASGTTRAGRTPALMSWGWRLHLSDFVCFLFSWPLVLPGGFFIF